MKRKLTKQDLKKTLAALGFKEGDLLELPSEQKQSNESSETNEGGEPEDGEGDGEGGNGGSNNPPKKPPFTP